MNNPPLIELQGVDKIYASGEAQVQALRGINLRIERGEFLAIMGPSGSGKSTLMNVLGLLDTPDIGSYRLEGTEVSILTDDERSRVRNRTIGFVFQNFNLLSRTSALRNVMLPLTYRDGSDGERRRTAEQSLFAVGLGKRMHHLPNQLSGGECQRVAIARALVTMPSVIMADEPTGNLDSRTGEEIMNILTDLAEKGKTIIMVSHDSNIARKAKRIIYMIDGRIRD